MILSDQIWTRFGPFGRFHVLMIKAIYCFGLGENLVGDYRRLGTRVGGTTTHVAGAAAAPPTTVIENSAVDQDSNFLLSSVLHTFRLILWCCAGEYLCIFLVVLTLECLNFYFHFFR